MSDIMPSNMRRVVVTAGTEIYPATVATEADGIEATEVADSIWQRYVAATAELAAVITLLEDLADVDHARRRCLATSGDVRCQGLDGHITEYPRKHWGWTGNGWDARGNPTWFEWENDASK